MGAVNLEAGQPYTLRASVGKTFPELAETDPHLDVRFNRRAFLERRAAVVSQGFIGFVFIAMSIFLVGIAWLRKRQSLPSKLIEYRNLKHNMRLSRRYVYRPYPGDAHLFLPERNPEIVDNTISSWRSVIDGGLSVDVIEGARRHLDLIDVEHGAEVARRFAAQLAAARSGNTE